MSGRRRRRAGCSKWRDNNRIFCMLVILRPEITLERSNGCLEGGMKLFEGLPEEFAVEVGIDLGGGNAFVAEHFLNGAEVGAAFNEVGGEGMAEGMRGDVLGDPGLLYEVFEQQEDHHAAKAAAAAVEEEDIFMAGLDGDMGADLLLVDADVFDSDAADGYQPFLVALADHANIADVEVEAGNTEVDDFADAEPAAVHGFEDGFVAVAFGFAEVDPADDLFDLIEAQHVGECAFQFGGFQEGRRVLPDDLFDEAIFIKGADAGEDAGLGGGIEAECGDRVQEGLEVFQRDGVRAL